MAKYYIPDSSYLGLRLLQISRIAEELTNNEISSKKKIIDDLNDIIRSAKGIRNTLTNKVWKEDTDRYKIKEGEE